MNFKTNELQNAVNLLSKVAKSLKTISEQQYAKVTCKNNIAMFQITSLDVGVQRKIPFTGKPVNFYIDVNALNDILKTFPKKCTMDISIINDKITISSNENYFTLPIPTEKTIEELISWDKLWNTNKFEKLYKLSADLIDFIKKDAIVCVSKNDFRLQMTGVCLLNNNAGRLEIASTDTYRLIRNVTTVKIKEGTPELIISGLFLPFINVNDYELSYSYTSKINEANGISEEIKSNYTLKMESIDCNIYFKPIKDKFPPYQSIIPKLYASKSLINVKSFNEVVKKGITLDKIHNNGGSVQKLLVFKVLKTDAGKTKPNFDLYVYDDKDKEIFVGKLYCLHNLTDDFAVNMKYLSELIKTMRCENIKMLITQSDKPILFQYDSITQLIMPVRLT